MNIIDQIKEAGISGELLKDAEDLHAGGFNDDEIFSYLEKKHSPKSNHGRNFEEGGFDETNKPDASKELASARRDILRTGGAIAGGAAGSFAGPAGTLAGGTLGYGMGEYLDRMISGKNPGFRDAGEALKEGAELEMGGQMVGPALGLAAKGANKLGITSKRIYDWALQMPTSRKWTKEIGENAMSERSMASAVGREEKVPVSEYGYRKAQRLVEEKANYTKDILSTEAARGTTSIQVPTYSYVPATGGFTTHVRRVTGATTVTKPGQWVKLDEIIDTGIARANSTAKHGADAQSVATDVKNIISEYMKDKNIPIDPIDGKRYIRIDDLNKIKSYLWSISQWTDRGINPTANMLNDMKKGVAHSAKMYLEGLMPELRSLNSNEGAMIALTRALETTAAKLGQKPLLDGMNTGITILKPSTWPVTMLRQILGAPEVKSRIAFALSKAKTAIPTTPVRSIPYVGANVVGAMLPQSSGGQNESASNVP
jgi:hypothetical protein